MDRVTYKPYRTHVVFVPFVASISIAALWIGITCMHQNVFIAISFSIIGMISALLTIVLYKTARMIIILDQNGLEIYCKGFKNKDYISWEKLNFCYLSKNYKGHDFWVISPRALKKEQVRWYANKGANTSSIYIEDVVVLFIDPMQNTSRIEKIIQNGTRGTVYRIGFEGQGGGSVVPSEEPQIDPK